MWWALYSCSFQSAEKIKQQKHFSPADQNKYKNEFPEVLHATYTCERIHKAGCGCFTDIFIAASRHKLFNALVDAKKDPNALKRRIEMLSHHVCDEHEWEGGGCDFHSLVQCNCGKCTDGNLSCNGNKYKTRYKLKCPYHILAYKIELHNRQNGLFPRNSVEATQIS